MNILVGILIAAMVGGLTGLAVGIMLNIGFAWVAAAILFGFSIDILFFPPRDENG